MNELEEGTTLRLDWSKLASAAAASPDVIPVAVQHADTKDVILVAYANEQALRHSIATRNATFWSTSRRELWEKGKTSGETFELLEVRVNCEQNSLVYVVRPRRGRTRYSSEFCSQFTRTSIRSKVSPEVLPFSHSSLREVLQNTADRVSIERSRASWFT